MSEQEFVIALMSSIIIKTKRELELTSYEKSFLKELESNFDGLDEEKQNNLLLITELVEFKAAEDRGEVQ
jgi:hypothetical protein